MTTRWSWMVMLLMACSPKGSDASATGADACRRLFEGACCEGHVESFTSTNRAGQPCTVTSTCTNGIYLKDGDGCFDAPSCPYVLPSKGSACEGNLSCTFPCETGTAQARCVAGSWSVVECGAKAVNLGAKCLGAADCDPLGLGAGSCSFDGVCVGTCTWVEGEPLRACEDGRGLCVFDECVPTCLFDDTGAAPTGCPGRIACHATSWKDGKGIGYCSGGCETDADCPKWNVCDPVRGGCASSKSAITGALGAPCGGAACMCRGSTSGNQCVSSCRVGGVACPSGFACDAQLDPAMTTAPSGIQGYCQKICVTDADCAPGVKCTQHGGMTAKTCTVGLPP